MTKINILKNATNSSKKKDLMDKIKNDTNMVKFTMNMPVTLHQNLKILAATKRINMADIILPLIETYLRENV